MVSANHDTAGSPSIDSRAVVHLFESAGLPILSDLNLGYVPLGEAGIDAIAGSSPRLTSLSLQGCSLTNPQVAKLAASPVLSNLRTLNLSDNELGKAAVRALIESPHLADIESLFFWDNHISEATGDLLEDRFGEYVVHLEM